MRRAGFFRRLLARTEAEIARRRPACALLVDYPGFNLRIAARLKRLGVPVIYYIAPQVWAWGRHRLRAMRKRIDMTLVILPFEKEFFDRHGVPARFVGHYLLEDIPSEYIASPLPGNNRLALLPGSRELEIARLLGPMLEAARRLHERFGIASQVAAIRGMYDYEAAVAPYRDSAVSIVYDDTRRVIYESDLVLAASGTATLEAGLIGRPMVITYRTGPLSYQIARRVISLDRIGLVNLTLGDTVAPELIQHEARPDRMAEEIARLLTDHQRRDKVIAQLHRLPAMLGATGASRQVADVIEEYL